MIWIPLIRAKVAKSFFCNVAVIVVVVASLAFVTTNQQTAVGPVEYSAGAVT